MSDCICLMGLGWAEAVPVDTHVWQIAQRDYKFGKGKGKTFSMSMYHPVGDFFRELWGQEAGWAHSVLFTADLKTFSARTVKGDASVEVKEEETTSAPSEESKLIPRKRQRAPSVKVEEPELKVPEVRVKRRSPRIQTKG